ITHVSGSINPIDDIEIINLELILADLETVNSRLDRVQKLVRQQDKEGIKENHVLEKIKKTLEEEQPARALEFAEDERRIVSHLHLLTSKPVLYVANVGEDEVANANENEHIQKVRSFADAENAEVIVVCANVEEEITELDEDEKVMFLEELEIKESGLDQLIKATYQLLGLGTYFTAGEQEVRAWTFHRGI